MAGAPNADLKAEILVLRKRPLNFGLCLGRKAEETVLVLDKIKKPEVLGKQAKKDGSTPQVTWGSAAIDGRDLTLRCDRRPPPGTAKKLKALLKLVKLSFKVRILDENGELLEEEREGEDEEAIVEGIPAGIVDKRSFLVARWKRIPGEIEAEIDRLGRTVGERLPYEDPDELCGAVRQRLGAFLAEMQEDLQDAIDESINAGDPEYRAVGSAVQRIRQKVGANEVLAALRKNPLAPGEPFDAAVTGALDEIEHALAG